MSGPETPQFHEELKYFKRAKASSRELGDPPIMERLHQSMLAHPHSYASFLIDTFGSIEAFEQAARNHGKKRVADMHRQDNEEDQENVA